MIMTPKWFCTNNGVTHGPFSEPDINDLIARKLLLKTDRVWLEGKGPADAAPAAAIFEFAQLAKLPTPDWLTDVAATERKGPLPGLSPTDDIPEWLVDLRLWVGLELYMPAAPFWQDAATQSGEIPEWLESWLAPPGPTRPAPPNLAPPTQTTPLLPIATHVPPAPDKAAAVSQPLPASSAISQSPPPMPPATPAEFRTPLPTPVKPFVAAMPQAPSVAPMSPPAPSIPTATLIPPTSENLVAVSKTTSPVAETAPPVARLAAPPISDAPDMTENSAASPQAVTTAVPAPVKLPSPANIAAPAIVKPTEKTRATVLVEQMREVSGVDLETGQILDPAKFGRWKQQRAQATSSDQPAVSNASLFDVFRKGRIAIETWVDDDKNRNCVMLAAADEIKTSPEVQAIVHQYANYGNGLQEKLLRHLEFMLGNRRRYYNAVAERSR